MEAEVIVIEGEVVTFEACKRGRLHEERSAHDTAAGILVSYGPNVVPTFVVHCVACCLDFGPFTSLAEAQGAGRSCPKCTKILFSSKGRRGKPRRRKS